jgi:transposase
MLGETDAHGYTGVRAVVMVEEGESRGEVARVLKLAPSTAVRWLDRWNRTGRVAAKPGTGHSCSPLKAYEQWLLDLVAQEPDLTLEEIRDRLRREKKLAVATSSVWRFYDRHEITKKVLHATEQDRPDVAAARKKKAEQPALKPSRLVLIDETAVTTKMTRLYGPAGRAVGREGAVRNNDILLTNARLRGGSTIRFIRDAVRSCAL